MSRKFALILAILFLILTGSALYDLPAMAAPQGQEGNQPEREQSLPGSYLGKDAMRYLPGIKPPVTGGGSVTSPVESWSRMAFETYFIDHGIWEIYSANGDFTNLFRLTGSTAGDFGPRLNRGGTRIVFYSDGGTDQYDIYAINPDGTNLARLTDSGSDDSSPVWSPDGTYIAFESYRDGNAEIYLMHPDGSGLTRLTTNTVYDGEPTWSPDGSKIAFTSYRDQQWRIWVMNADGSNQKQLSDQPYSELPNWSPDGGKIAFDADSDYDDMMELWVMNADGTGESLVVDSNGNQSYWASGWSPEGSFITTTLVYMEFEYPYWYWYWTFLLKVRLNEQYIISGRGTDFFLDWTTKDTTPPAVSMGALPAESPYQFTVSWSGTDSQMGLKNFDVQVRDGAGGAWTNWQMNTTNISAVYTGLGGHDYYFRVRGRDLAFNVTPWTANPQAHTRVESYTPRTHILPLATMTRGSMVTINWEGYDPGGSDILYYDVQYLDEADGVWLDWLTNVDFTSSEFSGQLGRTYHFRSRGADHAMNVEAWPAEGDTFTSFFSWTIFGSACDNTGTPVIGMEVSAAPPAFISYLSNEQGNYQAYVAADQEWKTITWLKNGYGVLPDTTYGWDDVYVDVVLPPVDNAIADWGFESGILPGDWNVDGDYLPFLTESYHSGAFAVKFMSLSSSASEETYSLTQDVESILSQSLTVPSTMANPTLSYQAVFDWLYPGSDIEFSVQVTEDITTTTIYTNTTGYPYWTHFWFDMTPWSGEQITLTFKVSENVGFPPSVVLLDEVTLGAANPDVWVDLSGPPRYADPGDTLDLELGYGNRGAVLAESNTITFTLPAGVSFVEASIPPTVVGNQLTWDVGDLAEKSQGAITLTLQVEAGAMLGQAVALEAMITTSSAEIEVLNNQVERVVYLGYAGILPIIRR